MAKTKLHKKGLLVLTGSVLALNASAAHASNFGLEIPNIAEISYTAGEVTREFVTNEVIFTIEPPVDENPTIEFFRHSPNAANPLMVQINGSDYSPTGELTGTFTSSGPAINTGNTIDVSGPVPLIPTTSYLSGELMFVRVTNSGANRNSDEIDTLVVTVEADNGDKIVLRLYESGPNTGEFWAYMQSSDDDTSENDNVITALDNTQLTATYEDTIANAGGVNVRVIVDTASINPNNIVFDSTTGLPVSGAVITLLDSTSFTDADVFGVDEFSIFPSTVTSGVDVTDEAGLNYDVDEGEFSFPHLDEGQYVIEVVPPEGYNFASVLQPEQINQTTGAGYFIIDASYGLPFVLGQAGPLRFDIPLDPESDLVLSKTADRSSADVGDYVSYTVTLSNNGLSTTPVNLYDTLPIGFRYVPGTSQLDNLRIEDPEVSDDATLLTYPVGTVAPGESIRLNYALEVGPGAHLGQAVNEAVVRDRDGDQLSNIARAGIELREDLLRTHSTIVGRISEQSCDGNQDWVREIRQGVGVEGVRLYMETGAYAVSDADGLYHFEGVTEGTHVVQIDEETLPQGFEPMVCEENSRYAGSPTSKFIESQGGGIWRANFYLKQVGETAKVKEEETFNEATDYRNYDADWLASQNADIEWVYPITNRTPDRSSVNIGIKHPVGGSVDIMLNGRKVPSANRDRKLTNESGTVSLSRFKGVDIREGKNEFEAIVKDAQGNAVKTLSETIWFATHVSRAAALPGESVLIADGRTVPSLAIRLEDEAGRAVHKGRIVTVDIESPYRLYDETGEHKLLEQNSELLSPLASRQNVTVGDDGIAHVRLEPTLQTGKVTAIVTLDNGRQVPIYMYLEPEKRDWILVGLAEGSAGLDNVKGNSINIEGFDDDDVLRDGRVAFFAKGMVKGNWLLTLAVDTDTHNVGRDGDFAQEIDPNAYYTLYGDRSYQEHEAQSRYPLYVKLEKRNAYALFGDFDTNITEGRLTSYNRRLSGLKAEYISEGLQVLGFAAETNQGFAKDEIAADGTSGTYQLSNEYILAQSETIVVETRDRNRPDVILESRVMARYLDYTLDYLTGQLIFRLPVDVSDENFNPNVIVADYETAADAERNLTAGGRVQVKSGNLRVGSSFVHQEGSAQTAGSESNMVGIDVVAQLSDNTEARLEYAITENKTAGTDSETAQGILAEVIHTSEKVSAEAYYREEEQGYGVGQTNSNTAGFRRYGAKANVKVNEFEDEKTGRRGTQSVEAAAYHEDNLVTGNSRDTAEVMAHHKSGRLNVGAGLRASQDELTSGETRDSLLAVATASLHVPKIGATFQASHEQPLGNKDEVTNYPQRTTLGVIKNIGKDASVTVRHEILNGENVTGENTVVGLNIAPWDGTAITAATDLVTNDSGRRLGATVGVDQQVRLDKNVTASLGVRNRQILDDAGTYVDVSADAAISPLEINEDFTSAYVGLGFNTDTTTASGRIETRMSGQGDTWIASLGAARELSEELSLAASMRAVSDDPNDVARGDSERIDTRLGAAWRPRGEETIIFDRLDISHEKTELGTTRTKIVNNMAANTMVTDRWQLAGNYGAKYVREDIAGQKLTSFSHLVGGETRFDITKKIDLGLHGSALIGEDSTQYSFGPSIGVSPVDNVWISAGYNIDGFKDDDFEAAEYTRDGVYLKPRIKFDQNTARGLLKKISPTPTTVGTAGIAPQSFSTP